jgi:hypothetical protein
MSDVESENEDEGVLELFKSAKISATGLQKLAKQEIRDKGTLLLLSPLDITHLKLAVADKARLVAIIKFLKGDQDPKLPGPLSSDALPNVKPGPVKEVLPSDVQTPPVQNISQPSSSFQASSIAVAEPIVSSNKQFSFADVAGFLSGRQLPSELNATLLSNQGQGSQYPLSALTGPTRPDLPGLFATSDAALVDPRYHRAQPYLPPTIPSAYSDYYNQQPNSLPAYVPALLGSQSVPSRMTTTQSLGRDPLLHSQFAGYQNSVLRDYSSLNNLSRLPAGEGLLYLPVNFLSHVRGSGSRTEDEELLQTESGAKLYFGSGSRKIGPEKLNQGLFFRANARILARLIPNLSQEVAIYLDYLRQIGDLLINYTSQSVYCLDHDHRFQVVELSRAWNQIDPTLALNTLKKKDNVSQTSTSSSSGSKSTGSGAIAKSDSKTEAKSYGVLPICWQWNQPDGCKFQNCRYHHKCSVDNCGGPHPAWKHQFRTTAESTSKTP